MDLRESVELRLSDGSRSHDALNAKALNELLTASTQAPDEASAVLSSLASEEGDKSDNEVDANAAEQSAFSRSVPKGAKRWFNVPVELGLPDGSKSGFYGLMRDIRNWRAGVSEQLLNNADTFRPDTRPLQDALASLQSISRPAGWHALDDDALHSLLVDGEHVQLRLHYEKNELIRDLHFLDGGEDNLLDFLRAQHRLMTDLCKTAQPSWDDHVESALAAMHSALVHDVCGAISRLKFRNLITDRDGTINNYCDRYPCSVQAIYNAVWVGRFARQCTENAIIITAAPLGGRPSANGLMELCTMPHDVVRCAGSKGREYYDPNSDEVLEIEPLPADVHLLLEKLYSRIASLCMQPENLKFLGIGSGLQRKFGEITVARNDISGSVSEVDSRRFLSEVRDVIAEVDEDGALLCLHDTGTDIDVYPQRADGQPCFSKGNGVLSLDRKLGLAIADGPNVICGDTLSDVPMVEAALSLMSACDATQKLAVIFVISLEQHERTPWLATKIRTLCAESGAQCAILPSPDILVAAFGRFAKEAKSEQHA